MASLYQVTGEILELQNMFDEGEIDQQVLNDTMEAVEGDYDDKLESYCKIIKNFESDAEGLKQEIQRLSNKKKILEGNIDKLKTAMFESMKTLNKKKAGGKLFTISIQKNGGKAPVILDVKDTSELPDNLVRIKEEADLDAIRALLDKDGKCKYAHYGERGESLRIK